MNFQDYIRYDAVGLAELIRKKEVSADEVLQAALNRLDEVNPKLNLLAHDLRERAAAWQGSSENADTPLAGVPFLLKDLLADWEGAPTWSGSRMMQHYIAKQNSDLTQAYLDAGLRVFGKTTTPEWGAYPVTETEIYGITRNPWHLDYTAGGSSGGAAAAVASGVVPAAHGSDGGGSIRLPAHNCGVFGLKPTRGRSSYAPNASEAWQGLVCDHVLTPSVRDSAVLLAVRHAALGFPVEKQPVFGKRSRRRAAIRRLYVAAEHERQPRHERAALPASRTARRYPVRRRTRARRHAA